MARSVPIWKILRFAKVSLYLERFVPRHATAHIHNVSCYTGKTVTQKKLYICRHKNLSKTECKK